MDTPALPVLGIYVGHASIDAVLVRAAGSSFEPLLRFSRPRAVHSEPHTAEAMAAALPGLSDADDYTLQVGGSWGTTSTPPATETDAQGDGAARSVIGPGGGAFATPLKDILGECAAAGFPDVAMAFCLSAPEVNYVVVAAPHGGQEGSGKGAGLKKRVADEVLKHVPGADPARIVTVPFKAGSDHMLALAPEGEDPALATLSLLEAQSHRDLSVVRVDSEATLLAALFSLVPDLKDERAVVVRVGADDTLLLFFEGPALVGVERLRSLTAYDLPETIVSRVLLRLDEKKLGDPDRVYIASVGRDDMLLARATDMLPGATVGALGEVLVGLGLRVPQDEARYRAGPLVAAAAAARELGDWEVTPDVQLLPAKRLRSRWRLPAAWHTILAAVVLSAAVVVAGVRYVRAEAAADVLREDLRQNPPVLPSDNPDLLQARVDSLNRTYATYTRSLDVLDSLLLGSDKWTQAMRLVTRSTVSTDGTWLLTWAPDGPNLRIQGRSLSRPQIVEMARRLDGIIEALSYTDIGTRRVYTFDLLMPAPLELPEVARYLREVREGTADSTLYGPDDMVVHPTSRRR